MKIELHKEPNSSATGYSLLPECVEDKLVLGTLRNNYFFGVVRYGGITTQDNYVESMKFNFVKDDPKESHHLKEAAKLSRYEQVNQCETYEELAKAIEAFGQESDGVCETVIQGRTRQFSAKMMADACRGFSYNHNANVLTRMYGIRQQALYTRHYSI